MAGDWSISLWDLHRLDGLPICGEIYDENVPHSATLTSKDEDNKRYIVKACEYLFVAYHCLYKESGSKRECDSRSIRPATFEIATLMACGKPFNLAVPVLGSIYHALNNILRSLKPSYSGSFFPAHYLYSWLAYYFETHHNLDLALSGPLMTVFSSQSSKHFKDREARDLIHEGTTTKVGCIMPNKNKNITLFDDGKLGPKKFGYLISLRSSYIPLRSGDKFYIEPYNPHRFGRQFRFCQDVPGMLTRAMDDRQLWSKVTVNDLRDKIDVLCTSTEADPNKSRKSREHASDTSAPQPKTNVSSKRNHEPLSKQGNSKSMIDRDVSQGQSSSDGESDVNYKHKCRGKRRSNIDDVEDDTLNNVDSFGDLRDFPVIPTDLPLALEVQQLVVDDRTTSAQRVCAPTAFEKASMVYRCIQNLKGDPAPLKRKVESYVCSVKSYLALEDAEAKRQRSEQVKRDILAQSEVLKQDLADEQKRQEQLKEQDALVTKRVEDLEAELTKACEEKNRLTDDLLTNKESIKSIEEQMKAVKQTLDDFLATPILSVDEIFQLEQQKVQLQELQLMLKPFEWMD
uniref:Aminotransferase-like plant mobile domain-containing protein n=1 Tax=Chenopodium quinoa TaxID=63459 RepID=A0A803M8C4_CHEQI